MAQEPDILLLAGPTASGKSALSIHAARKLDAEIINADSMQVYKGLQILTARPTPDEMVGVRHHLFGVIDPSERCSTGRWARLALDVLDDFKARRKRAVFVGGTGLYFKALTEGLAPVPDIPAEVQASVAALFETGGLEALYNEALRVDPIGAKRLEAGDRQRLMRLIAVARAAGQPLSQLQADTRPLIEARRWRGVVIQPDRETLYSRIEQRFDHMMAQGAVQEARMVADQSLDSALPAMKAVGLPPLLSYLRSECDLDDAVTTAKRDSRRYAKRQYTWFSNQHSTWARIVDTDPVCARRALDQILEAEGFNE